MAWLKERLKLRNFVQLAIQGCLIGIWFLILNRHELFSVEGYQYSKYNGIYFLCGALAGLCLFDNLGSAIALTRKERVTVIIFSALYAGATALASYPVFERMLLKPAGFIGLVLALAGGFAVSWNILGCALRRFPVTVRKPVPGQRAPVVWWLAFGSIAAVYLLYFFCVAYPGYFTRDSFSAVAQCLSGQYDNNSPFYHTMLVKLCIGIGTLLGGSGSSAVCVYGIVQSLMMAAAFAYLVVTLYQARMPGLVIGLVWGLFPLLSYNLAYSATMWKDIPFSIAALLMVTAMYRILKGLGRCGWLNEVLFILGGAAFCLMRTNGWYSYLVTALILAVIGWKRHRRMLLCMCAVLAVTWVCNNPVLSALGVSEGSILEPLAVPFQQIARVVVEEEEISASDMEMIEEIFDMELMKEVYDPLTVDPVKFEAFRGDRRDYLRANLREYAGLWVRLGVKHPWTYLKAWVDETQGYWNAGYHFWIYPDGGEAPEYGITRTEMANPVAAVFDRWFHFIEGTPPITQPLYGIGFQVWVLIFCCILCALKKREEFLLTIPVLVIVVGLWLGTPVFAEFRYAYPVFVTVPLLLSAALFDGFESTAEAV